METEVKRLFVGGLPSSATDSEIKTRFGRFGDISGVKLSKKDSVNGKLEHCFAHFNFHGDEQQLKKLIGTFNSTRWKGKTLKIERAKEDFLDKLAKEKSELPQDSPKVEHQTRADQLLENLKKAGADNFMMKKAVPGTGITGEKNWVVSKYGRVLPVLYLRTRDRRKVVKFDPSKYIHHLKQIKDIRDSQVNQSWKGEAISPTSVRKKWLPREQESDGVEYCGQRTGSKGYEDQRRGKGMGHTGMTNDAAKVDKDAKESSACHASKPANAKKVYFNDGSSDEDSGTFDGSLKRKPGYDGNLADENKGSKSKKMKKLEMTSANTDISSGTIPEEIRVHKPKAILENKVSVKGRGLVSFGKANTGSYLFKFFGESDSSPSEVEHIYGSVEENIESIVDEDSVKSPLEKTMEMSSDLKIKNKKEQNTADAKNVEVEVNKNMSKSEGNFKKVNERKPRRDTSITGNIAGAKTELTEDSDCSSSSSEETGDRSETTSALTEAAVVADGNQSGGGMENEPSSAKPHEQGEDDLIASIIAEMKHKETAEKRVTDLGRDGRGIDGRGIKNLGDLDNQSLQRIVNETESRGVSQNIYQERVNSNDHHHFKAEVKKDKVNETERTSAFNSKKLDVQSKSEGKNEENSIVAEANSSKEKLTKRRWEKNGSLPNDNSSIVGEGGSSLFKSTLLSLSKQRQGEKSHTESDRSSSDEDKEEDHEMGEKAIAETGLLSELVSKKSSEEKDIKNSRRTKNSSNCRQASPSDIKMREVELRTDEQINEKEDIDFENAEEYLNLQGEDLKEMHFKPLILDRVILKMQGFIPEEEPCDSIIDERDTSSVDDSESESSQSSSDGKASKKRKKKKRIKFVFHEFKGMNHFRKEFIDKESSDVNEGEKLDSVHREVGGMDSGNCCDVRTSHDQPTDGKDFSNLRGGGGMEELEDDERTFGEDGSRVNEIPQTSEKMVFAVDSAPRRKKSSQVIKNCKERDSVEVREENDDKEMDADDESSSSESVSSDSILKKKSSKNIRNVIAKSSVSQDEREAEILEGSSLSSGPKVNKEAKHRTKTSVRNIQTKNDSDEKMECGDYEEKTEDEGKALSISKGEKKSFKRTAKTSLLVEECKTDHHPSGDEKGASDHRPSEDLVMGDSRAGLKSIGRAGKTISDSVAEISNQKRLKALKERRDELKQKQKAINVALSSVDSREKSADKNHMRFESSSEDDSDTEEEGEDNVEKMKPKGGHMTLFGDSDEEEEDDMTPDDERFQLKPQFEGEKGAKLLKLQDKFGDDERFRLDERFAEDDADEDGSAVIRETEEKDKADPVGEEEGEDLEAEKDRYLAVLENVLGKQLPRKKVVEDKKSKFVDVNYLHFDPTREDHAKFELPKVKDEEDSQLATSKKRKKKKKKVAEDEVNDPLPEVSKELFSEVTVDLVSAFSQEGNVTSFNFFEDEVIKDEKNDDQNKKAGGETVPFTDNFLVKRKLPWDSSDSEQEAEHEEDGEKDVVEEEAEVTVVESTKECREAEEPLLKLRAPESFFFAKNDNRLQGVANQFCRGKNADVTSHWKNARTQILKAGTKRHQKALRDNQKNRRRGRPATSRSKSSVGKS